MGFVGLENNSRPEERESPARRSILQRYTFNKGLGLGLGLILG